MRTWAAASAGTRAAVVVLGAGAVAALGFAAWQVSRPDLGAPEAMPQQASLSKGGAAPLPPVVEKAALPIAAPQILTWAVTAEGMATVAGRAASGAQVQILIDGARVAETFATSRGDFAIVTRLAPNPSPSLMGLMMRLETGEEIASAQTVALGPIAGPAQPSETAVAADAPTGGGAAPDPALPVAAPVSSTPPAAIMVSEAGATVLNAPASATIDGVTVETVSYTAEGAVQLGGSAAPEAYLRLYVNDAPLAETAVPASGKWLVTVADLAPGRYWLRVDQLDAAGKVTARYDMPFARETRAALAAAAAPDAAPAGVMAAPDALAAPADAGTGPVTGADAPPSGLPSDTAQAPAAPGQTSAVNPAPERAEITITVQPGHTLWAIARGALGDGPLYVQVYEANREKIGNPDLIYPGQVFTIPGQ